MSLYITIERRFTFRVAGNRLSNPRIFQHWRVYFIWYYLPFIPQNPGMSIHSYYQYKGLIGFDHRRNSASAENWSTVFIPESSQKLTMNWVKMSQSYLIIMKNQDILLIDILFSQTVHYPHIFYVFSEA